MEMNTISPPFLHAHQLCSDLDPCQAGEPTGETRAPATTLPGQPRILLSNPDRMAEFLVEEFWAHNLETVAPRLWVMSTQSSANVNPLHRQRVKGREIVVTEDPRLHLHESDLVIAQQDHLRLVPKDVSWTQFCGFISAFVDTKDTDVSGRYYYGELRLSRLNLYAPLLFRTFHYEQVYGQYGDYFARLYGPVLFVFAVLSTVLNAMQVEMAVEQVSRGHWEVL
ncbi:hypothetical protein LTR28_011877 [Elasticomyces elasticus]|nr:hypothetical protein LTR28_011877 [Elasticomyces elasticus]